jgi:hypothetical protein
MKAFELLIPSELVTKNRAVAYTSIILIELLDYHFQKTDNGFHHYKLRRLLDEISNIKSRLESSVKYS